MKKSNPTKKASSLGALIDIVPDARGTWDGLLHKLEKLSRSFGFSRVETALLEDASVYENYALDREFVIKFPDLDNHNVALKPQNLQGLLRVYAERKDIPETEKMAKWYYVSQVINLDPNSKNFANSWEYGFELFGEFSPLNQIQLMSLLWKLLKSIGLRDLALEINTVGTADSRREYEQTLKSFLQTKKYELCNDCVVFIDTDAIQVFRCRNLGCKAVASEAPQLMDFLSVQDNSTFTNVLEGLDELGIAYNLNTMMVGDPCASGIVFAFKYKDAQREYFIGQGCGHDILFEKIAFGRKMPCFGFSGSLEVLRSAVMNLTPEQASEIHIHFKPEVFLVPLGDLAAKKALRLFSELWDADVIVYDHFGNSGIKNQLKMAEDARAIIALIIGQKEAMEELVILRDVKSGMQEIFQYERIVEEVKKRLGKA